MLSLVILMLTFQISNGLQVAVIGDFGDDSTNGRNRQENVARAMSNWCGIRQCDFIISTADNFYPDGVLSVNDVRFNDSWRWVYDKPNIDSLTWYMSLGNHDYQASNDRGFFQIEFGTVEPRWVLPWLWYDFHKTLADGATVHFIVVDSMSLIIPKYDWEAELAWYNQTLSESTADWKIVIVHHPPYSVGNYGPGNMRIRQTLVPGAEAFGADLMLCGHDHNLQHIAKRTNRDVDYIISGGGGRGLYAFSSSSNNTLSNQGFDTLYFGHHNGFVILDITAQRIVSDFFDSAGILQYAFIRQK